MNAHSPNGRARRQLRKQLFIAPRVQGKLMLRIAVYCIVTCGLTAGIYMLTDTVADRMNPWVARIGPLVVGLSLTMPVILYDAARASNRLLGPFARVHGAVRRIANQDHVSPIRLRDNDYWREWIDDFNIMVTRIQANRSRSSASGQTLNHKEGCNRC